MIPNLICSHSADLRAPEGKDISHMTILSKWRDLQPIWDRFWRDRPNPAPTILQQSFHTSKQRYKVNISIPIWWKGTLKFREIKQLAQCNSIVSVRARMGTQDCHIPKSGLLLQFQETTESSQGQIIRNPGNQLPWFSGRMINWETNELYLNSCPFLPIYMSLNILREKQFTCKIKEVINLEIEHVVSYSKDELVLNFWVS